MEQLEALDRAAFLVLNGLHAPWADEVMRVVDRFIWIPLYLLLLIVLQRRFGWRGLAWAVPSIALLIFMADKGSVLLFKETVQRLRPCFEPLLEGKVHLVYASCGGKYGFVSSHASNHFAIAVFMSMALRSTPRWATAALLLWAALIAYSRVYLGVHYPGDVLVGGLWGTLVGFLVGRIYGDSLLQGNTHECLVSDLHRRWRWQCAALRGLPCSVAGADQAPLPMGHPSE
ncbi:MAG: phosphatase PAP2 family protein [Flavobacteriales bacterium]|nr:phosphatase PAP2 family protein [Flavobacteriales bacterium]